MYKQIKFFLLVCLMLFSFASCNDQANDSNAEKDNTSNASDSQEITFFHYKETLVDGLEAINNAFMQDNPEIKIRQEMVATEYNTLLASKINVNKTPDIFVTGTTSERSIKPYIDEKLIAELSNLEIIKKLPQELIDSVRTESGDIYVLPFLNTARGIIYNKQIFEDAGIDELPKTLDELEVVCQKIKALGITPFGIAGSEGWSLGSIPWQVAQEAYSDKAWIDAMWKKEASFLDNGLPAFQFMDLMLKYGNENLMDVDFTKQVVGFSSGKYAMVAQGPWFIDTLKDIDQDSVANAHMMAIPVSNNPQDAKLYIDNDVYLLISSQADLESIDKYFLYIYEGRGKNIFQEKVKVLNAFGIQFETHPVNQDILKYIESDNIIVNFQYNHMPDGFWQSNAKVMQEYVMGKVSKEEALKMLDDEWNALARE